MPEKSSKKSSSKVALAENSRRLKDIKELFGKKGFLPVDIENFPIATCITCKEGFFKQVNEAYCSVVGYTRQELLGKHFTILVPNPLKEQLTRQHHAFIQGEEELQSEWEIINKSGELKFILSSASLFTDRKLEPFKASFIIDITKIKQSERTLKESGEAILKDLDARELSEDMLMHDVRKPIANIIGICSLLLKAEHDPEKVKTWINILNQEASKSLKLLDTKAGFKRMELRTYQLELSDFNLLEMIRNILAPLEPKITEHSNLVTILLNERVCTEESELLIRGDAFFLEIMLNNLIVNALEASPAKEVVTISLTVHQNKDLIVTIHNAGVIPEKVRNSFFDKYTTFGKSKGLGIGTYTAKIIAKAHSGDIFFTTSEQDGTTLHVQLPGTVKSVA